MMPGGAKQLSVGDSAGASRPAAGRTSRELLFDSEAILRLVDGALTDLRVPPDPSGVADSADAAGDADPARTAPSALREVPDAISRLLEDVHAGRIALSARRLQNLYGDARIRELTSATAMLDHVGKALLLVDRIENDDPAAGSDPFADLRHELFRIMNCLQFHSETVERLDRALSLLASTESRLAEISRLLEPQRFAVTAQWDDVAGPVLQDNGSADSKAGKATEP